MALSDEAIAELKRSYPHLAYMLNIPGLGDFFEEIYNSGTLTQGEFEQRFWASPWFRSHSDSARSWDILVETDPATATQDRLQTIQQLELLAGQAGLRIAPETLKTMAEQILRWGLDENDMVGMLADAGGQVGGTGTINATVQELKQRARAYFVNLSDAQAQAYALDIFAGRLTKDGVFAQFHDDARAFYPHFADSLDRGLTLDQATYSMRSHVAGLLNMTAEQIDLTDQRFAHLIDYTDENGNRRMKDLTEVTKWSRQQDEFRSGVQGMKEGSELAMNFLGLMGKI